MADSGSTKHAERWSCILLLLLLWLVVIVPVGVLKEEGVCADTYVNTYITRYTLGKKKEQDVAFFGLPEVTRGYLKLPHSNSILLRIPFLSTEQKKRCGF